MKLRPITGVSMMAKMLENYPMICASAFAVAMLFVVAGTAALPKQGSHVAVILAPWEESISAPVVIAQANATIVRADPKPWLAIASDDGTGVVSRLYGAGAFLVLDASFVTACLRLSPIDNWISS